MIRNALWRTYDSSYGAAKSLLAWSGLGKRLTRDGRNEKPLGRLARLVDTKLKGALAQSLPNPIEVDGLTIHYDASDPHFPLMLSRGEYESQTTAAIASVLAPGMTFLDLGAHVGYFTLLAARAVGPRGRVYAFEPEPRNYALLAKNVAANGFGQVTTVNKAAFSECCSLALFHESRSASVYLRDADAAAPRTTEAVTMDAFFGELGWPAIDLIKMDIEGAESAALQGMRELSRRNPRLRLVVEFNLECLDAAGVEPDAFFDALTSCGFSRFRVVEDDLRQLDLPADLPHLVHDARHSILNLLCEKESPTPDGVSPAGEPRRSPPATP